MNYQVADSTITLIKFTESKIKRPHLLVDGAAVSLDDFKPIWLSNPAKDLDELIRDWIVLNFSELMLFWKGQTEEPTLEDVL